MFGFLMFAAVAQGMPMPATCDTPRTTALTYDDRGRPVIRVRINGRAAVDMIVDTAAQSSVVTNALATTIGLSPTTQTIDIVGMTGRAQARLYPVRKLAAGAFELRRFMLVELPNAGLSNAGGIIGMDLLSRCRLTFDRSRRTFGTGPSGAPLPGFVAVKGGRGELFVHIPIAINGTAMTALVDSGAAVSVANRAALAAMGWTADDARLSAAGEIRGSAAGPSGVRVARMEALKVGPATLRNVPVYFQIAADEAANEPPMLTLGSDILNQFPAYAVDLPNGELHIAVPAAKP